MCEPVHTSERIWHATDPTAPRRCFQAKEMTSSIKPVIDPAYTLKVGNGAKAMAFLKKCEVYWRNYNKRRR
jgi:hypothetical protein